MSTEHENEYIRLPISEIMNEIYRGKPLDRFYAWIDLTLLSNYKDKKTRCDGKFVLIKRGQYLTSIRKLAVRWNWSEDRVSRFLGSLEKKGKIVKDCTSTRILITIVNYDRCPFSWRK